MSLAYCVALMAGSTVVTLALAYGPREDDPSWQGVSRYARGRDYHDVMRPRLTALVDYLHEAGGPDVTSRAAAAAFNDFARGYET